MGVKQTEALKLALEVSEEFIADYQSEDGMNSMKHYAKKHHAVITAIREALAEQPAQQDEYGYAKRLAEWLWQKHYAKDAPDWVPFYNLAGVLTQIDNMVCRLVKEQPAPVAEPVAWRWTESNGRHWFDWRTDWTHHDRAKAMGFAIEYAYTSPPNVPAARASKPWVGLTNQELIDLTAIYSGAPLYCAIEAKLREKNA